MAASGDDKLNQNFGLEDQEDQEQQAAIREDNADLETGIVIGQVVEIPVTYTHKQQEIRERENRKHELGEKLKIFQKRLLELDDIDGKRIVQMKMMEINDEIDELNMEEMTEEKFQGAQGLADDEEAFDYGRDIIKEGSLDMRLRLPYKTMPLFTNPDWYNFGSKQEYV